MLSSIEPVSKITIIPRGIAGGYTKTLSEDKDYETRSYIKDLLAMMMGGRTAEELVFNEMTNGASSDIKHATDVARNMVTNWGMSDKLGPRTFGQKEELVFLGREISEQRDYGDKVADLIDEEVNAIITESHEKARNILTENRAKLTQIAETLLVRETLEGEELEKLFNEPVTEQLKKEEVVVPASDSKAPAKDKPATQKAPLLPELPKQSPATS
jgi:cell division protease FtsH